MTTPNPQQPNHPQPDNPNNQQPKQKKPIYKRVWFWAVIAIVVILIAAAIGTDTDDTNNDSNDNAAGATSETTNDGGDDAEDDNTDNDGPATIGETQTINGTDITVDNPEWTTSPLGDTQLCAHVTYSNNSDDEFDIDPVFDWTITNPNGATTNASIATDGANSVTIQPGGTTEHDICFDIDQQPGEYEFTFTQYISFNDDEAHWKAEL
ncbi:DUF4352 domain-containing protein [Corynebacterium otitidis]|uniref:DUF4352 domain-containing protein n=1 Tax=Corynebacterium otitidis TaxID=29321 RepID=UPI00069C5456|nr:DUF4352 domain-containing protein [Corynebacterium otitidis]